MNDTASAAAKPVAAPAKPAPAPKAAAAPSVTLGSGLVDVIESLKHAIEPELVALYEKAAPWYVQMAISKDLVRDGVEYGFAMAEGAAKDAVLAIPTAQTVLEEAIGFVDAHMPAFLRPYVGPAEDIVIVDLQKLGALPPGFSRAALPKAA